MEYFKQEFRKITAGLVIFDGIMILAGLLFGLAGRAFFTGLIVGSLLSFFNFYFTAKTIDAIYKKQTKKPSFLTISYFLRFSAAAVVLIAGLLCFNYNLPAAVLPLFAPKLTFTVCAFVQNRKKQPPH